MLPPHPRHPQNTYNLDISYPCIIFHKIGSAFGNRNIWALILVRFKKSDIFLKIDRIRDKISPQKFFSIILFITSPSFMRGWHILNSKIYLKLHIKMRCDITVLCMVLYLLYMGVFLLL